MKLKKPIFEFDPTDLDGMIKIMQDYGDSEQPFGGKNENGEDITISVSKNCIVVHTYQKNGWIRRNIYTLSDGDIISEELFDGK